MAALDGTKTGAKPGRNRQAGCGCSGLGGVFVILICLAGACWPIVLNAVGASTRGVVLEKFESVRIEYGDWFRHFQVTAGYSIPGQPFQRRAVCDVDEKTYDALRTGSTVEVRYLRSLPPQPFLSTARLTPCSIVGISMGPSVRRLIVIVAGLFGISVLWWILGVRLMAWVLLAWVCFSCAYAFMPRLEPQPQQSVAATAKVNNVTVVDALGETSESDGIPLQNPYQIVELKFVPRGMDAAVVAIDKVDQDSIPGLMAGQDVPITYDAAYPRIAKLQEGTRLFAGQAWMEVLLCCAALAILGALVLGGRGLVAMLQRMLRF